MPTIGTTAETIESAGLIQNLGPDAIYFGGPDVTTSNGMRLAAGESMSVGTSIHGLYVVSDGTSDVRSLGRATGIFKSELPT